MFSFMDRVSIGNARLYGMEDELGMENNDYLLAVSVLFITYCVCRSLPTRNSKLTVTAFRNAFKCSVEAHAACQMVGRYYLRMGSRGNFLGFLQQQERLHCMPSPSRSLRSRAIPGIPRLSLHVLQQGFDRAASRIPLLDCGLGRSSWWTRRIRHRLP